MNQARLYEMFQKDRHNQQQQQQQHQPPDYSTVIVEPTGVVVHRPGVAKPSVETAYVPWSWCHLVTAVISICCCCCLGVIATICSILAYVDHKGKDYRRSLSKRQLSSVFGIVAIVVGSFLLIIVIALIAAGELHR